MADDIFISYARVERETTLHLVEELWALGYTTWIDAKLAPGEIFEEIINAAVDQAKAVITIWSKPALKSRWVKYESNRGAKKLICTHTAEVDPGELPADFHGMHAVPVADVKAIVNSLLKLGVRPAGVSEEELPEEAVLERQALRTWRAGLAESWDVAALEAFLATFGRARLVAEVAERRLRAAKARAATAGDAARERIFKLYEAIERGTEPDEFLFFLRRNFTAYPEIAVPAAERLQELDPDAFLAFALETPGAGERLSEVIEHAERLIRLRDTPPGAAVLRLDPGMHIAGINRIGVSADGRLMATGSEDKTVKLWALPEGKLIRTLRPPIGPGDEGKVYAVALDPAGRWVAAGGWSHGHRAEGDGKSFVSLFDAATGRLIARLGPLPNVVFDLAVSPDGRFLAGGLGGANGLRVWDVSALSPSAGKREPIFEDRDYGDSVYGLAFAADGRLAATSWDGQVRLYGGAGAGFVRRAKAKAPGGAQPFGIAFAPDGARLAIGYDDALRVDLLDAATLAPLSQADVSGLSGGNFCGVAFLPGAAGAAPLLVAGGTHGRIERPIYAWTEAGAGPRARWPGPESTVMDLEPAPGAGLAFGAADPAFGLIAPDGTRALFRGPATADLRNKTAEHFTISADGCRLRFGLKQGSAVPVLFDLAARRLADAPQPAADLAEADVTGLNIAGWEDTTAVTLTVKGLFRSEQKRLPLQQYETARSLAVAPDAKSFILGAEWRLRRFDSKGAQLWEQPVPGIVWGVNLAREGRLILAAYGDGTIRWHRADDGKELLALFIHLPEGPDGPREWILFTPEGFYDASSPEAEKLIGWHVNRGPEEAADFYPVETFAATFKRPDKIDAALAGL